MIVGVLKETFPGERRVALVPAAASRLIKGGWEVVVQAGAGIEAGFADEGYRSAGARVAEARQEVFEQADVLLTVRALGANPQRYRDDLGSFRNGQILIAMCDPLSVPEPVRDVAGTGAIVFALELIPRTSRAQTMDVLSSMAMLAGYKTVLLAANALPSMFPMMMTAAGTLAPAKVLVIGAGVAGLQAIATARRLGAVVEAYDVRAAAKEEAQSLGAKFLDLPLETEGAEDRGGYARQFDEEFYRKQRELLTKAVAANDVVITTAAVPGKRAPMLVTQEMVAGMHPGSVLVDLAAERGGNCEATRPGETVVVDGVTIIGPANLPSDVPKDASQLFARNVSSLLAHLIRDGQPALDTEDDIIRSTMVCRGGEVQHPGVKDLLSQQSGSQQGN